jgi:predicted chitinase
MLTSDELRSIMPGLPAAKSAAFLPPLDAAMTEFAIDAPVRAAAFLAQLAHESGQLRFMEEIWGPTAQQLRYEPASSLATSLGNTQTGDGKRFKGRGPIQITGRANYQRFGNLLGVDLVTTPEQAALPDLAFRIAGLYWSKKGLNELADQATDDAFREITRRINGGFNGLADRQQFYATARAALGVTSPPVPRDTQRLPAPKAPGTRLRARDRSDSRGPADAQAQTWSRTSRSKNQEGHANKKGRSEPAYQKGRAGKAIAEEEIETLINVSPRGWRSSPERHPREGRRSPARSIHRRPGRRERRSA